MMHFQKFGENFEEKYTKYNDELHSYYDQHYFYFLKKLASYEIN
jgi:hypothetical protein